MRTKSIFNNISRTFAIALPLVGFLIILAALNLYQYVKIKHNIASTLLSEITNIELLELKSFFEKIPGQIKVVREWGENGLLLLDDTVELNKKFFPIVNNQEQYTGILLADSGGREYYLYRSDSGLITRTTQVDKKKTRQKWQRWTKPDHAEEEWEDTSDYDPRQRPWFVSPRDGSRISWTSTYTFFQTGKPGISASVSWIQPGAPEKYMVFGVDILVERIQALLSDQQQEREGILFIINPDAGYYLDSAAPSSTDFLDPDSAARQKESIDHAIDAWQAAEKPTGKSISFMFNKQKWLTEFRPLGGESNSLLIGVAASEKDMAASLQSILFEVDLMDLLVAVTGGVLMLLAIWRHGRQRTVREQDQKMHSDRLMQLIDEGEGTHLEFKASVRYNIKTGKPGKEIELAWLKAVVSFLNSEGGKLLLGVGDDGALTGIEHDKFDNDDRCLLHVKNLLNQHIGPEFARSLTVHLLRHEGHQVVVIECGKSGDPVFLKTGKNEDFFVRSGPSNTRLSPSQIISYLKKKRR